MQVGDKVVRYPTFGDMDRQDGTVSAKAYSGTVVYIHPEKRFHMVEFDLRGQKIRECFQGT